MCDKPVFAILPTGGGKSCVSATCLVAINVAGIDDCYLAFTGTDENQVDNLRNKTAPQYSACMAC